MSMTKKDFIALADVLRSETFQADIQNAVPTKDCIATAIIIGLVSGYLAAFCAEQNPRFNRERWMDYVCRMRGPSGGKV